MGSAVAFGHLRGLSGLPVARSARCQFKRILEANVPLHVDRRFGVSSNKILIDSRDDGGGRTEESERTS